MVNVLLVLKDGVVAMKTANMTTLNPTNQAPPQDVVLRILATALTKMVRIGLLPRTGRKHRKVQWWRHRMQYQKM